MMRGNPSSAREIHQFWQPFGNLGGVIAREVLARIRASRPGADATGPDFPAETADAEYLLRRPPPPPTSAPATPITLLLAEDHAIVRHGLCVLLNAVGHFRIVGEARNGREAVEMAKRLRPDVILMDIAMPVLNGLDATREIYAANPASRVLILSAHRDEAYIERARTLGAAGFVAKLTSTEILIKAICDIAAGLPFFGPSIATPLAKVHASRLTARETEVLRLVAEGSTNKQVAAALALSFKTVEKHRKKLMDKLNIHDTAGLTCYAHAMGVVDGGVELTVV